VARTVLVSLVLAVAAAGCQGAEPSSAAGEKKPASARPAEGAMCEEHGVLEAVCTKCNPKLAAVFKAKGDWCAEHGFPESFCPICHPERAGKPAAEVAGDGAPADGTKVRFRTKETARLAGIETAKAEVRAGGARLEAVATIVYDATRHAQINGRADGVVRRIDVDVGAQVKKDAPLAQIESAAVGADRSRVRAAATKLKVAEASHRRTQSLYDSGIAPQKDLQEAGQVLDEARSELAAARAALGMVGAGEAGAGSYTVRAPIAGTVIRRGVTIGHLVDPDDVLFEIVDTSTMWVDIDVPEDRVREVASGQAVTVVLDAVPGREWKATLDYVAPEVDPRTRTARARARIDNGDGALRANLYGRALIELGAARPTVMVPREAVQRAGGASLVFVRLSQDVYEARRVKIGLSEGNLVELASGVKPGEPVATRGSFLLKTETLKGAIGAGCCDVE
jgi:cobalt-zinc-cadmium efflux system membrane fusion protein